MKHYFFLVLLLLSCTFQVAAIGVSPARYDLNYEPGLTYDFTFKALNNQDQPVMIGARLARDMVPFSTISPEEALAPVGGSAEFTVHMELPATAEGMEKPGKNILEIYFVEKTQTGQGSVSARTGVIPWVVVDVPFPERYAEITAFGVSSVNQGNDATGSFSIKNRGNEDLDALSVTIRLYDNQGSLLQTKNYEDIPVSVGQEYKKSFTLSTSSLPAQDYHATLTLRYDDKSSSKNATFRLGDLNGEIISYPSNITKGGIVPFDITVANHWNGKVFISGQLNNPNTGVIETPRAFVLPFKTAQLKSYVDTASLPLGEQNFTAAITIEDQESGEQSTFNDVLHVQVLEPGKEKRTGMHLSTTTIILAALIVLLVITTIIVITQVVKRK